MYFVLITVWYTVRYAYDCVSNTNIAGFEPNKWQGFFVGLIQSFLIGAYAGLVYVPVYNFFNRRWAKL